MLGKLLKMGWKSKTTTFWAQLAAHLDQKAN